MHATSNHKVLVDIPLFPQKNDKEKIIFSRKGGSSLLFKFKKIFWEKDMQIAAAKQIKNIFQSYSESDATFKNPFQYIKVEDGIDEKLVIDALADLEKRKKLEPTTKVLPAELENAKTMIDENINATTIDKIEADVLLLAHQKCSALLAPDTLTRTLNILEKVTPHNLTVAKEGDCNNVLTILNFLKKQIPKNPDDVYINKINNYIDDHVKSFTKQLEKLKEKENKVNKGACETTVKTIIEYKNKIAATLSRHISALKQNNKALIEFITFLENPTASFNLTREISTRDTLENLIEGPPPSLHENYKEKN